MHRQPQDLDLMTPSEVADLLRISARQVRRMREAGLLTPWVSPWRPKYRRIEVEEVAEHLGTIGIPR
jgi:DNA-binding transcriptional MerR regulator